MNGNILSVSELTGQIRRTLEDGFGNVSVRGEISNLTYHSSGHKYFSIKDEGAQISCVMWRGRRLVHELKDGMKVVVHGNLSVYPPRGNYQIDCFSITPDGLGDLHIAFEALKEKLAKKGYFDENRKKRLPEIPMKIGIATSPTGAALQDMLNKIRERFPLCEVVLRPTICQGDASAADIVQAIIDFEQTDVDAVIIGRGGGSLEDLWSFNTEIVADAIYTSNKIIISAVGHEPDVTISDYVADIRAATPTAAAVIVTPITIKELMSYLDDADNTMSLAVKNMIKIHRDSIDRFMNSYKVRKFIDNIRLINQSLDEYETRFQLTAKRLLKFTDEKLNNICTYFNSLYPLKPLDKGFALLRKDSGDIILNDESLTKVKNFAIERKYEIVKAKIDK